VDVRGVGGEEMGEAGAYFSQCLELYVQLALIICSQATGAQFYSWVQAIKMYVSYSKRDSHARLRANESANFLFSLSSIP
jgi:hypothetical protein